MNRVEFLKACADETRLKIISRLLEGELSVLQIAHMVKKSQPNTSLALRRLEFAGIAKKRKEGQMVFYSLSNPLLIQQLLEILT